MNINEKLISIEAIHRLIKADYYITVDYDRGYEPSDIKDSKDVAAILSAMDDTDDVHLMVDKQPLDGEGPYDGFIHFIWGNGNEGMDCISNYSGCLTMLDSLDENWMEQETCAVIDSRIYKR